MADVENDKSAAGGDAPVEQTPVEPVSDNKPTETPGGTDGVDGVDSAGDNANANDP